MKTLLFFTCLLITLNSFAQKTIQVKNAHELAVAMNDGNFVGTSDIGATVRISELPEHLIVKNYTANSELKITNKTKEEKTTSKATGIIYTGNYKSHPVKITMIVQDDKIRAKVSVGEQRMVVVGVIKSKPVN
jgi:hypothetical protein